MQWRTPTTIYTYRWSLTVDGRWYEVCRIYFAFYCCNAMQPRYQHRVVPYSSGYQRPTHQTAGRHIRRWFSKHSYHRCKQVSITIDSGRWYYRGARHYIDKFRGAWRTRFRNQIDFNKISNWFRDFKPISNLFLDFAVQWLNLYFTAVSNNYEY